MKKLGVALAVVLLATGCFSRFPYGNVPAPFHCATNIADQKATVLAQARFTSETLGRRGPLHSVIRALDVRQAKPNQRVCFRWPWISDEGRIGIVVGRDTSWGEWMNPWESGSRRTY